jgi:GDP-4-dehydro-6-deoxy-D-mannose reductase
MRELLQTILAQATKPLATEPDPARMRPSDVPILVGDNTKLRELTGWKPQLTLEDSLRDTFAYWREQAAIAKP